MTFWSFRHDNKSLRRHFQHRDRGAGCGASHVLFAGATLVPRRRLQRRSTVWPGFARRRAQSTTAWPKSCRAGCAFGPGLSHVRLAASGQRQTSRPRVAELLDVAQISEAIKVIRRRRATVYAGKSHSRCKRDLSRSSRCAHRFDAAAPSAAAQRRDGGPCGQRGRRTTGAANRTQRPARMPRPNHRRRGGRLGSTRVPTLLEPLADSSRGAGATGCGRGPATRPTTGRSPTGKIVAPALYVAVARGDPALAAEGQQGSRDHRRRSPDSALPITRSSRLFNAVRN